MHNCYHKDNMYNSFYIHKRWSSYFPAQNARGQTLTQRDWVQRCHRYSYFSALNIAIIKRLQKSTLCQTTRSTLRLDEWPSCNQRHRENRWLFWEMKVDIEYYRLCLCGTCNRDSCLTMVFLPVMSCVRQSKLRLQHIQSINFVYIFPNNGHLSTKATGLAVLRYMIEFSCVYFPQGHC